MARPTTTALERGRARAPRRLRDRARCPSRGGRRAGPGSGFASRGARRAGSRAGSVPGEAGDRPSAAADVVAGALAVLFGARDDPVGHPAAIHLVVLQLSIATGCPGAATIDWLGAGGRRSSPGRTPAAEAAPTRRRLPRPRPDGAAGGARGGAAERRARRLRQPRDLPGGGLDRRPGPGWARWIFARLEQGWMRRTAALVTVNGSLEEILTSATTRSAPWSSTTRPRAGTAAARGRST